MWISVILFIVLQYDKTMAAELETEICNVVPIRD